MIYTPFESLSHPHASLRGVMAKIGIGSVEELLSLWRIPQLRDNICRLTEMDRGHIHRMTADLETRLRPESRRLLEPIPSGVLPTFCFGALEDSDSGRPACLDSVPDPGDLYLRPLDKVRIDLIPRMPPVRSQGGRGACVAFAAASLREFFLRDETLSPQFLYWACKETDGIREIEGTWLRIAIRVLEDRGICTEADWHYNPEPGHTPGQGPPPDGSEEKAQRFKILAGVRYAPGAVNDIRACLLEAKGRPVAISVPVFASWLYNPLVYRTGEIRDPLPREKPLGGHAMVVVGMDDADRRFYIRNSWGTSWASESILGPGYGTIGYQYIAAQGREAFTAEVRDEHKIFYLRDFKTFHDPEPKWARATVAVLTIILAAMLLVQYNIKAPYAAKDCVSPGATMRSTPSIAPFPERAEVTNPDKPLVQSGILCVDDSARKSTNADPYHWTKRRPIPETINQKGIRDDEIKLERLSFVIELLKQANRLTETIDRD